MVIYVKSIDMNRLCFIMLFLFCSRIEAQYNDTIVLKEVYVKSNKVSLSSDFSESIFADSLLLADYKSGNISDLLSNFGLANIKSYGPGMLSSVSVRGTSASQTTVNWNGININNSMNGQSDISLIPVFFADEFSVQNGGSSTVWGSGSIGGTINIENKNHETDTGITFFYEKNTGSYNLKRDNIKTSVNIGKTAISIRAFNQNIDNNFTYKNIAKSGSPSEKLINAKGSQAGIMPEIYINIKNNQILSLRSWLQTNLQQIPPTMLTINNHEQQSEKFARTIAEWKIFKKNEYFMIKTAYFKNIFKYSSDLQLYTSIHKSDLSMIEAESSFDIFKKLTLKLMLNNTYEQINSTDYNDDAKRNSTSFAAYIKWYAGKTLFFSASAREEYYNSVFSPFLYSFGINKNLNRNLILRASASRNFRYPSFNDLYWKPGGNQYLEPESGYNQEISIKWASTISAFKPEILLSVYNSNIYNRIMWLPEGSVWTAGNWSEVWSRGAECNFFSRFKISENLSLNIRLSGNYNRATGETANTSTNDSDGKQLIYTPLYSANSSFSLLFKKLNFNWYYHISGKRYTSSDNTSFLEPFNYSAISISKSIKYKILHTNFFFRIDNVFNNQYQITEWRPMPPLNYQIGMSVKVKS